MEINCVDDIAVEALCYIGYRGDPPLLTVEAVGTNQRGERVHVALRLGKPDEFAMMSALEDILRRVGRSADTPSTPARGH